MKSNADLAETFPPQEQEPVELGLRAVEGAEGLEGAKLEVPDFPDFTEEAGIAEDGEEDLADRRQHAGVQAGRMATSTKLTETMKSKKRSMKYVDDDSYKGGGGYWWRKMKEWAKENHESDCLCYICGDPYVIMTG